MTALLDAEVEALPEPTPRKPIAPEVRATVYARDNHRCVSCGTRRDLTVDHITPLIFGGADSEENYQTLCRACNTVKGTRSATVEQVRFFHRYQVSRKFMRLLMDKVGKPTLIRQMQKFTTEDLVWLCEDRNTLLAQSEAEGSGPTIARFAENFDRLYERACEQAGKKPTVAGLRRAQAVQTERAVKDYEDRLEWQQFMALRARFLVQCRADELSAEVSRLRAAVTATTGERRDPAAAPSL